MKKNIKILIITLNNKNRKKKITNRLKQMGLDYKIINGIDGRKYAKNKKLDEICKKKLIINNIGRSMTPSEIGCAASHLKSYKYIVKNKIQQAIIMEDDCIPSLLFKSWIKNNYNVRKNEILNFSCYPDGFVRKKPLNKVINNKVKIYHIVGHTMGAGCYQINNETCKNILYITKGKVIGIPDWPFLTSIHNIKLLITIPFMSFVPFVDDNQFSYIQSERNAYLKPPVAKNKFLNKILNILKDISYLTFIAFFIKKYKNIDFYKEHFFYKKLEKLKHIFVKKNYSLSKIYYNKNFYLKDLVKFLDFD